MNSAELTSSLSNFYGSEQWFRHPLNKKMLYTEGVRHFAKNAGGGAYWFLDILATEGMLLTKDNPFMSVTIKVVDGKLGANIEFTNGDETSLLNKRIDYTDCPVGNWKFFMIDDGEQVVALLPSEY